MEYLSHYKMLQTTMILSFTPFTNQKNVVFGCFCKATSIMYWVGLGQ